MKHSVKIKELGPNWKVLLPTLCFLMFCLWLAYQVPYTHDDWEWGLPVGVKQLLEANLNARYAGNLTVVALTRSVLLKTLVMGSTLFALPALMTRIAAGQADEREQTMLRPALYIMGAFLLFSIQRREWAQTFGWVSGFANFAFSLVPLSGFLILALGELEHKREEKMGLLRGAGIFLLCFSLQLFLENITVYVVVCAAALFIVTWIRDKRPSALSCIMLIGAVAGAAVMFSSSMYNTLLTTGHAIGDYRRLAFDRGKDLFHIFTDLSENFLLLIAPNMYCKNPLPASAVMAVMLLTILKNRRRLPTWLFALLLTLQVCELLCWAGLLYGLISQPTEDWTHWGQVCFSLLVNGGIFLLPIFELVFISRYAAESSQRLIKPLLLWVSAPLALAPLVVVTSIGSRTFLTSDFFIFAFSLSVLASDMRTLSGRRLDVLAAVAAVLLVAVCVRYGVIYRAIGEVNVQRLELIADAKLNGADTIVFPAYPYKEYMQFPDPALIEREAHYREFYGIPGGVVMVFETEPQGA